VKATPIPQWSRTLVRHRDLDLCARCGMLGAHWHHRRSRSVRDELTHSPCNGLWLCAFDHAWVHANPREAREAGFIVSRHEDPRYVPVDHAIHGLVYLTEDGDTQPE
jgi:hypothetical protein